MRLICISDTHNQKIEIPNGDVLIHAGDATNDGTIEELRAFSNWFKSLPHKTKIFVAGNHDVLFEKNRQLAESLFGDAVIYLQDSSVMVEGIKFYGSPWQPVFFEWAFCLPRGSALAEKWKLIPDDVEVLITHSPPHGILDAVPHSEGERNEGCEELRKRIEKLRKLKLHIFGHIHEGYGSTEQFGIKFFNASICNGDYLPIHEPIVIDL